MERDLEKQVGLVVVLQKEVKEKEVKFLDLYMENSNQHDKILELNH